MASAGGNEPELIAQFQDVTGVNTERAKFFMEASGWDLNLALVAFYEEAEGEEQNDLSNPPTFHAATGQDVPPQSRPPNVPPVVTRPPAPVRNTGMATLDSLRQQEDSSDEDEHGQAFFAGGSITSGQQVLGPPGKKKDEFIKALFEKAKENAATVMEPSSSRGTTSSSFGGAGYKLGDSVGGSAALPSATPQSAGSEPCEVVLRLWRAGFTVDDGELRLYSDPENVAFLESVKSGEIPRELVRSHPGQEVHMALEDLRHEQYEPRKPAMNPFSGQGHMLGSPAPPVVSAVEASVTDRTENETRARAEINVTENEPMTNLQFRLADGTRLVARFNHTHRVSDLHAFINGARPEYRSTNYVLTLFPNRDLTDMEVTIKDANILNAALTQKMKSSV